VYYFPGATANAHQGGRFGKETTTERNKEMGIKFFKYIDEKEYIPYYPTVDYGREESKDTATVWVDGDPMKPPRD
jgi:hypothetical protein